MPSIAVVPAEVKYEVLVDCRKVPCCKRLPPGYHRRVASWHNISNHTSSWTLASLSVRPHAPLSLGLWQFVSPCEDGNASILQFNAADTICSISTRWFVAQQYLHISRLHHAGLMRDSSKNSSSPNDENLHAFPPENGKATIQYHHFTIKSSLPSR